MTLAKGLKALNSQFSNADASIVAEVGSLEITDDQESLCSSTGRDGDAFPKAFEHERIDVSCHKETITDQNIIIIIIEFLVGHINGSQR